MTGIIVRKISVHVNVAKDKRRKYKEKGKIYRNFTQPWVLPQVVP